jgi:hypothetical protein
MAAPTHVPAIELKDGIYKAILKKLDAGEYPDVVLCRPKYIKEGVTQSRQLDNSNVTIIWSCNRSNGFKTRVQVICNRYNKIIEEYDTLDSGAQEAAIVLNKYSNLNEDQVLEIFFHKLMNKCSALEDKVKTLESVLEILKVRTEE